MAKTLTDIALEAGLATPEVVSSSVRSAQAQGLPVVVVLIRENGIGEAALANALHSRLQVPLLDSSQLETDSEAIRRLDRETCRRFRVMPLSISVLGSPQPSIQLLMADPTDAAAIHEVESQTGCDVEPRVAELSVLEGLIESHYRHMVTEVMERRPSHAMPRGKFGGNAQVTTVAHHQDSEATPETVPFHRIADEAELEVRLEALVNLLIDRGVLSEAEYDEAIRELMKQRS